MQKSLIILGLFLIPFYELIFRIFPFVKVDASNTREPKLMIAMALALGIGLSAVFEGKIKKFNNKWVLIFPVYLLFSYFSSPQIPLFINEVDVTGFWFWKPFAMVLCFLMMTIAVSSIECDYHLILKAMCLSGFIMALYMMFQKLGFDQYWIQKEGAEFYHVTERAVGGNLGHSTIVSAFLIMIIPISFYLKKNMYAMTMLMAVMFAKSEMALLAVVLMSVIACVYIYPKSLILVIFIGMIFLAVVGYLVFSNKSFVQDLNNRSNGRFAVWGQIWQDFKSNPIEGDKRDYSFTGVGLGSFPFVFSSRHTSIFKQAHNDFLELLYVTGFFGLGIVFLILLKIFTQHGFYELSNIQFTLLLSIFGVCVVALGSFPLQLGVNCYFLSVIFGLANNDLITRRIK